jgi:hypothetical protein
LEELRGQLKGVLDGAARRRQLLGKGDLLAGIDHQLAAAIRIFQSELEGQMGSHRLTLDVGPGQTLLVHQLDDGLHLVLLLLVAHRRGFLARQAVIQGVDGVHVKVLA